MSRNANRRDLTRRGTKKLIRKVVEDLSGGGGLVGNVQSKAAIPAKKNKVKRKWLTREEKSCIEAERRYFKKLGC